MAESSKRGRRILAAGARTAGRGLWRIVSRSEAGAYWSRVGEDWYETLGELKGAAMKLGQLASQYHDLFPPELASHLARLQSDATSLPWERISEILDSRWAPEQHALIRTIDTVPIASASIGQVHKTQLSDGRELAIKIRYPGISEAVDSDINNIGRLLKLGRALPVDNKSIDELLNELKARLNEEVDYLNEAQNISKFLTFPAMTGIVIPKLVSELCTDSIIATEFIAGSKIDQACGWTQEVRDAIGENYIRWLVSQIFDHGLVHADPHPGNFQFDKDGTIFVFDFGCVREVSVHHRRLIAKQIQALIESDIDGLHLLLCQIGSLTPKGVDRVDALRGIYSEGADYFQQRLLLPSKFDFSDATFINDARALARKALPQWRYFKPVPELAFVARALSGGYWLLRRLGARVNLRTEFERIAAQG